jgi:hypothetical protein
MNIRFLAFLALTASFGAGAQTMYKCVEASGTISYSDSPCRPLAPPTPAKKGSEPFMADLLFVKSHADIETWVKTEPAKRRGNVGRMRTVTRDSKLYMPVVATFSQSQVGQRVSLMADLEIVSPTGKTQRIANCCLANTVDPRAPMTIVLSPVVDMTFDSSDPKGEYRVRATLSNGRESVTTEETIRLQ